MPSGGAGAGAEAGPRGPADVRDVEQVEEAAQRVLDDDDPERIDRAAQRRSVRRLGSPEDVAEAVLFVARSPYINGTVLYVDGGPEVFRGEGAHV